MFSQGGGKSVSRDENKATKHGRMVRDCHNEVVVEKFYDALDKNYGYYGSGEEKYEVKGSGSRE